MPAFRIIKSSPASGSFRSKLVRGSFEFSEDAVSETFEGEINLPPEWNVGLIVGASGTGKSTIANAIFKGSVFKGFDYSAPSVIDDMKSDSFEKIVEAFSSVGFGSMPSWLKPYSVLSNGEKMRVDMARLLVEKENDDVIAYDEFTSFLDREVARTCAISVAKAVRRNKKKFIGITCHNDVASFMEPDWIFCTDDMSMRTFSRGSLRREGIPVELRRVRPEDFWKFFSKHHYLSHYHKKGVPCIVAFLSGHPAAFLSWSHFPHLKVKNICMVHRIVVLPDYQGIGLMKALLSFAGAACRKEGKRLRIISGNYVMKKALLGMRDLFTVVSQARQSPSRTGTIGVNRSQGSPRIVVTAEYVGP